MLHSFRSFQRSKGARATICLMSKSNIIWTVVLIIGAVQALTFSAVQEYQPWIGDETGIMIYYLPVIVGVVSAIITESNGE